MVRSLLPVLALAAALACDRNMEPYVEGEEPRQPDLSKIFPAGANEIASGEGPVEMPAPPERGGRAADPTAEAAPLRGVVRVAPELESRVPRGGILFLIARRGGGGPPLAVQRIPGPRFPLAFEIGPDDRMIKTLPFAGELTLSARLDLDGDAASRTPGDLQGSAPGAHAPGAADIEIVLDEVI